MNQNYGERLKRRKAFVEQRKRIMGEFKKIHPEGITPANLAEAQAFMKKQEREIKKEAKE